jgi:hypothetical protein
VKMLTFHFPPRGSLAGEFLDKPDRNLPFDALAIGFPQGAEVQHPSLAFFAALFFEPTALMSLCH